MNVFLISPAPSGSPQNVTALSTSPTSLLLTWAPPTASQSNGQIVSYTVNVTVMETEEMSQLVSTTTIYTLTSLRPYYTYSISVSASTIIGDGPFSLQVTIRMPEDGTNIIIISLVPRRPYPYFSMLHTAKIEGIQHCKTGNMARG